MGDNSAQAGVSINPGEIVFKGYTPVVAISPGANAEFHDHNMPDKDYENTPWQISPLSEFIGFPVKLAKYGEDPEEAPNPNSKHYNLLTNELLRIIDPQDPKFGSLKTKPALNGTYLIAQRDGLDIRSHQVQGLFEYLMTDQEFKHFYNKRIRGDFDEPGLYAQELRDKFTPRNFITFWTQFVKTKVKQEKGTSWCFIPVPNPDVCGYCLRDGEERQLLACPKCQIRGYCSDECWAMDAAKHDPDGQETGSGGECLYYQSLSDESS